jgi:Asp-tRNA(Asn)/Glu-tRNA(Gln) amidotransferase A subunit family amidase
MNLSMHTKNLIWGEAKNAHNHERSCGGSSGGDAGMVLARCVPLGLGSDIGGSLRLPATFCGIYGFKPTQYRLSRKGMAVARQNSFN